MSAPLRRMSGLRGRLLVSVLAAIGLLLVAMAAAFNLVLADRLDNDASGVAQARASAEVGTLVVSGGRIRLPDAADERSPDAQLWVYQGQTPIEQPRSPSPSDAVAASLARVAPAVRDVAPTHMRLYALPVVQSGRRVGTVIAGVSLAPYEQTRRTALVASIALALGIFVAVAIAAHWLISKALRPVALMTRQAAEWSEQDLDRRFSLGAPHDELTQLAATLDRLLDRRAASLRHEQRLSAELSHELRTPLASIGADSQYALRHTAQTDEGRNALQHILDSVTRMSRTLDTLIAAARAQLTPGSATSDAVACARAAVAAHTDVTDERGVKLSIAARRAGQRVAVEQDLVERILAPLIENACRHARRGVEVVIDEDRGAVRFRINDDGPGVAVDQLNAIFNPGWRAGNGAAGGYAGGAGLGLALARRLARSAGGEVTAEHDVLGGRFTATLPAA
jgi:two-component system OmpR family sensor kinase